MITFKSDQSFSDFNERMAIAVFVLADILEWLDEPELMITSTTGGEHIPNSRHYSGDAIDVRSRDWNDAQAVADALAVVLGDDYDVVLESDHLHVEWDPKAGSLNS